MTKSLNLREAFEDSDFRPHDEAAFNAGWNALLSEIAPLIKNNLLTLCIPSMTDVESLHNDAVERLRELVKEE